AGRACASARAPDQPSRGLRPAAAITFHPDHPQGAGQSTWKWADLQSSSGKTKAYVYLFGKTPPAESPLHVAAHGSEVPYAFDNLEAFNWTWDATDHQLARIMST